MVKDIKCPYCEKVCCKRGIKGHMWKAHGEGKDHNPQKGKTPWNKGLTKDSDIRVNSYSKHLSEIKKGKVFYYHTVESKANLSVWAKKNNLGGHTSKRAIRYKTKEGNEIYLQSSYEENVAKSLDDNGIKWIRPEPVNWIDGNNKEHRYYGDFYLPEYNVYLDPKNDFLIKKDEIKIKKVSEQNNITVLVLNKKQLCWDVIKTLL